MRAAKAGRIVIEGVAANILAVVVSVVDQAVVGLPSGHLSNILIGVLAVGVVHFVAQAVDDSL